MKKTTKFVSILLSISPILTLTAGCLAAPKADQPITVRVASYNVEYGSNATPEQIGEMFKPYNLDIIGFQEAPNGDWTARAGNVLGMKYSYVSKITSANHKNKYKSILSRTPLEGMEEYSPTGRGGWQPVSVIRAVTQIDGVSFAFYSLHISKSGKHHGPAYSLATDILAKETMERVISVGDYNNNIGDHALIAIEAVGMTPTREDLNIDPLSESTYNALKPKEENLGVIDHIFYNTSSLAKATDGGIIELEQPLSDHKPIWAQLVFPRKIDQ